MIKKLFKLLNFESSEISPIPTSKAALIAELEKRYDKNVVNILVTVVEKTGKEGYISIQHSRSQTDITYELTPEHSILNKNTPTDKKHIEILRKLIKDSTNDTERKSAIQKLAEFIGAGAIILIGGSPQDYKMLSEQFFSGWKEIQNFYGETGGMNIQTTNL